MAVYMQPLADWVRAHPGRAAGCLLGVLAGVAILVFGFWQTLLIAFLGAVGWLAGRLRDEGLTITEYAQNLKNRFGRG